jgi:hypothetical protein
MPAGGHFASANPASEVMVMIRQTSELTYIQSDPGHISKVSRPDRLATGVPAAEADAIVEENEQSRLAGLRTSLAVLAIFALLAFVVANGIPTRQPGHAPTTDVDA